MVFRVLLLVATGSIGLAATLPQSDVGDVVGEAPRPVVPGPSDPSQPTFPVAAPERLIDVCDAATDCFPDPSLPVCPVDPCLEPGDKVNQRLCSLGVRIDGHIADGLGPGGQCKYPQCVSDAAIEIRSATRAVALTDQWRSRFVSDEIEDYCQGRGDCDQPLVSVGIQDLPTFREAWDPSGFNIECALLWFEPDSDPADGEDDSFLYMAWDLSEGSPADAIGEDSRPGRFPLPFDADGNGRACDSDWPLFGSNAVSDDRDEVYRVELGACAELSRYFPGEDTQGCSLEPELFEPNTQFVAKLFQDDTPSRLELLLQDPSASGSIPSIPQVVWDDVLGRITVFPSPSQPGVNPIFTDQCIQEQLDQCAKQGVCSGSPWRVCSLRCEGDSEVACRTDEECGLLGLGDCDDGGDCPVGQSCAPTDANNVELLVRRVETSGLLGPHVGRVCANDPNSEKRACLNDFGCPAGMGPCRWCGPGESCYLAPDSDAAEANRLALSRLFARFNADTFGDPNDRGGEEVATVAQVRGVPGLEVTKEVRCVDDTQSDAFGVKVAAPAEEVVEFKIVIRNTGSDDLQVGLRDVLEEVLPQGALADCELNCQYLSASLLRSEALYEVNKDNAGALGLSAAFFTKTCEPGTFLEAVQSGNAVTLGVLKGGPFTQTNRCLGDLNRSCSTNNDCRNFGNACISQCEQGTGDELTLLFRVALNTDEAFCELWQEPDCRNAIHAAGQLGGDVCSGDQSCPAGQICSTALGVCVTPCPQGQCDDPRLVCANEIEKRAGNPNAIPICVDIKDEAGVADTRDEQEKRCNGTEFACASDQDCASAGQPTPCTAPGDDNVAEVDILCRGVDLTKSVEFTGQPTSRGKQLGVPGIEGPDCEGASASCFVAHESQSGCGVPTCQAAVCAARPSCCATSWDAQCAALALNNQACLRCHNGRQECTEDPPDPSCRDYCVRSDAPGCPNDACAVRVCAECPECCEEAWSKDCADLARGFDECRCDGAVVTDCCEAADPGSGRTGCNDSECQAIVCAEDSFCCEVEWDGVCASVAQGACDICQGGVAGEPGGARSWNRTSVVAGTTGCAGQANPLRLTFGFEVKNCGEVEEKAVIDDAKLCADLRETRDRYPDGIVFDCPMCVDPKETYYLRSKPSDKRCLNGAPCAVDADCPGANAKCLRRPREPLPAEQQICRASCTVEFRAQNVLDYFLQLDDCDASCCIRDQQGKCSCDACGGDQGCPSGPVPSEEPQSNDCYVNCATASTLAEDCIVPVGTDCSAEGCVDAICKPVIKDSDWTQICKCPLEVTKQVRCVADCNYSIAAPESDWLDKVCSLEQTIKCTADSDCNGAGVCDWPEFVEGSCLEYRVIVKNISGGNICRLEFADSLEAGKCRGNASKSCRRDSECGANGECLYAFEAPGPGQCELAPFASCQSDANCPAAPPGMTNRCLHVKPGEGRCKNNQAVKCDSNADCPAAGNRCLQVVTSRDGGAGLDTACQSAFYGVAPPNSYNWDGRPHVCDLAAPLGPDQTLVVKYGAKLRTFDRAANECGVEDAGKWPSDVPRDNENVVTVQGAQGSVGPTCPSDYTCRGSADQTIGVRDCDFTVKKDVTCLGPNGDLDTASNWEPDSVEALPGDWVGFRIQVKNTGTVPLQTVKIDDVLTEDCKTDNWMYQEGSIRILNSGGSFLRNAKPCACTLRANPACPAGSCPTLACLNGTKDLSTCGGLQPGEILEVRFKLLVPQYSYAVGLIRDCTNTMAVSTADSFKCAKPCPECSDSADVYVKIPKLECEKGVCRLGDGGSTCVQGPSSDLALPCDATFPLRLQYRIQLSNYGDVDLPDAQACDAQLIGDALATAASGVVIEGGGCELPPFAPCQSDANCPAAPPGMTNRCLGVVIEPGRCELSPFDYCQSDANCPAAPPGMTNKCKGRDLATVDGGPDRPLGCSTRQLLKAVGDPRDITFTITIRFNHRFAWDAFAGKNDIPVVCPPDKPDCNDNKDSEEDCYKNIATATGTATLTSGCNRKLTEYCDATVCLPECLLEVNKYARCIPKLANGACNTGASEVDYPWKRDGVCSAKDVPCGAGQPCEANTCSNGICSLDGKDCSEALPCYNECVAFEALPGDCVEFKIEVKNTSDDDAICALKIQDLMTNAGVFVASDPTDVRCWQSPPGGPAVSAPCPPPPKFNWENVESVVRLGPAFVPTSTYVIRFWGRVKDVSSLDIARNTVTVTGAPDNGRGECPTTTEVPNPKDLCYSEDCKDESSVAIDVDRCKYSVEKHARCMGGPADSWMTGGACPGSEIQPPALEVLPEGKIEYRIRACNDGETVIDKWRIKEIWGCAPRQDYEAGSLKAYVALKSADGEPLVAIPESAVCPSGTGGPPDSPACAHPGEIDQPNYLVQSVPPSHCIVITFQTKAKSNAPKCDDPPGVNCKDPEGGCCSNGVTVEAKASGCAREDRTCSSDKPTTSSVHVKTIVPHIECEHKVCALLDSDDTCDVGPAPGITVQSVEGAFRMRFFYTAKADLTDVADEVDKFTDVVISDPRFDCSAGMGPGEFCPYKDLSPGACDFSADGKIQVGDVGSSGSATYQCTLKFASVEQWKGLAGEDSCTLDESRVCGKPHLKDVKICPSEWRSVDCCEAVACVTDVCCKECPPVTKAKFEIFNENEVKLSGLERCIPEWDSTWLSDYTRDLSIANFFTIGRLGTNKGMARIEGMRSPLVCGDESIDTPLVGVATKLLMFEGAGGGVGDCDGQRERATMSLVGTGTQAGWFKYPTRAGGDGDNPEDPGPELAVAATDASGGSRAEGTPRGDRTRPMDKDVRDALEAAARIASTDGRPRMEGLSTLGSKGSLLVFPLVEAKSRGGELSGKLAVQDTFISLYNDYPMTVHVQAYLVSALVEVDCEHRDSPLPDCPVADIAFDLTKNESKVWSALRGFEDGSFSASTIGSPCPDDGPCASGAGVFRGYLVVWAVNDKLEEVHWNHLAGSAVLVNYEEGSAWEYGAWPFRSVVSGVATGQVLLQPLGQLDLDGNEYEAAPDTLLLDFYATGTNAFGIPGKAVGLDTELTLVSLKRVFELPRQ